MMRKAIVMAGGQGSRLWPLTATRPKPLVPVANRPVMAYLLEWLRRHDVTEVLVTLHYRADDIRRAFGEGRAFGLTIAYRVEEQPLGTAGAVKAAEAWIDGEPFLVVSGDGLTDLDLEMLCRQHRQSGAILSLGLTRVGDRSAYGVVELNDEGRVSRFLEKPGPGEAFSRLVNTGIYCMEPEVLCHVPERGSSDWSRDVFPRFLAQGLPLFGQELEGYWCDVGNVTAYRRAQRDLLSRAARGRVLLPASRQLTEGVWAEPDVQIARGAVIEGPVLLGAGCRIDREARVLAGSIIGARTVIRGGARVEGAVIGARCRIGAGALVRDAVIDDETALAPGCWVTDGSVVGHGCRSSPGVRLGEGERVAPEQIIGATGAGEASLSVPAPGGAPSLAAS
jgi:mannose-1-phosphate guanylyltransferase/phosphomannomutase